MNNQDEDQRVLISQLYPAVYTQMATQQGVGVTKPRRRRKKSKAGESGTNGLKKRKLSEEQVNLLEMNFGNEHKLESERKDRLASELGLDPRQVAVWFQNRRARWKSKKLEEEYSSLKKSLESVVVDKSHLESEILRLKEQLLEAEKEIQRLSETADNGATSNSPSSSISINAMEPPFLGEFGVGGYEDVFYMQESNYIIPGMDWVNLYI